jgi:lipooligosaccharide transport system permease protein
MICTVLVPGIDSFNYFYTLFMTPMFLFSGIFFPLDTFSIWVTRIAFFTPLYHLTIVCRAFAWGMPQDALWSILWLFVVAIGLATHTIHIYAETHHSLRRNLLN